MENHSQLATPNSPLLTRNPYVGPRAFEAADRANFFGRDTEIRQLADLVVAQRAVLLYASSGAGKTSLINAGLIPALQRRRMTALPVARVGGSAPAEAANPFVFNLLSSLADETVAPETLLKMSLREGLSPRSPLALDVASGARLLVLDQFEELFTQHAGRPAAREDFFAQLQDALEAFPHLSLLLAMREEYLAYLDSFSAMLPDRLRARFRLELLDESAARLALQEPARAAGVPFDDDAARHLVDDLRRVQVQQLDGSTVFALGPAVEPVQLQVVAYRLWESLPPGADHIGVDALAGLGDVNRALRDYYAQSVARIAAETDVAERAIREWVERQLITAQGRRDVVARGPESSGGLANAAIGRLVGVHLVRAEQRAGATWYELAHDRLVDPLQADNAAWFAEHLSLLQRQAALWDEEKRPAGLLLSGDALAEAEAWAARYDDDLIPTERDFLTACREAQARARREQQQTRRIQWLAVGATVLMLVALATAFFAWGQMQRAETAQSTAEARRIEAENAQSTAVAEAHIRATAQAETETQRIAAVNAQATAETERERAEQQSRIALGRQLAAQTLNAVDGDLDAELSLLLAVQAVRVYQEAGQVPETQIDKALRKALSAAPQKIIRFATVGDDVFQQQDYWPGISFSPSGHLLLVRDLCEGNRCTPLVVIAFPEGKELFRLSSNGAEIVEVGVTLNDQALVVTDSEGTVTLLGLEQGEVLADYHTRAYALHPQGSSLALATEDGALQLLDLGAPGFPATRLASVSVAVLSTAPLVFQPGGEALALIDADRQARLWLPADGRVLHLDSDAARIEALVFSDDGRYLAGRGNLPSGGGYAALWETATGRRVLQQLHADRVDCVHPSATGGWLAIGAESGIHLWNVTTLTEVRTFAGRLFTCQGGQEAVPTFSPDETRILLEADQHVELRTVPDGELVAELNPNLFMWMAFTADSSRLAVVDMEDLWRPSILYLIDALSGANVAAHQHRGSIYDLELRPGKQELATLGSRDPELMKAGTVYLWDAIRGTLLRTYRHTSTGAVSDMAFSPVGQHLATIGTDNTLRVWDLLRGGSVGATAELLKPEQYAELTAPPVRTEIQGNQVIVQLQNGTRIILMHQDQVDSFTLSPNGALLVSRTVDYTLHVWDIVAATELTALQAGSPGNPAFNADGSLLVTVSFGEPAQVWESRSGKLVGEFWPPGFALNAGLSADGSRMVTLQGIGFVRRQERSATLWDVLGNQELATVEGAISATFSPDVTLFAAGCMDNSVHLLDAASGAELGVQYLEGEVHALAFSLDGGLLAAGDTSGMLRVWNTRTFHEVATLTHADAIGKIVFGNDGTQLFSWEVRGQGYRWTLEFGTLADIACRLLTRNLSDEEWRQYLGDELYRATCPNLPEAPADNE